MKEKNLESSPETHCRMHANATDEEKGPPCHALGHHLIVLVVDQEEATSAKTEHNNQHQPPRGGDSTNNF